MTKAFDDMTPEERDAATKRAVAMLQAELTANAPAIARILNAPIPEKKATAWRIWGHFPDNDTWRPVSHPFKTKRLAGNWALKLNMDHRTEEEDI